MWMVSNRLEKAETRYYWFVTKHNTFFLNIRVYVICENILDNLFMILTFLSLEHTRFNVARNILNIIKNDFALKYKQS